MEFYRLFSAQDVHFAGAFALYEASFPEHEQRPLERQQRLLANPLYHFEVIVESGALAGIILSWDGLGYTYIEHFAIQASLRGNRLGAKSLADFCGQRELVVLEIDPPLDQIAVRRKGFYQRLGFQLNGYPHVHPAYQPRFAPHELVVMSYPQALTEAGYQLFQRELKEVVMRDAAF